MAQFLCLQVLYHLDIPPGLYSSGRGFPNAITIDGKWVRVHSCQCYERWWALHDIFGGLLSLKL